MVLEAPVSTVTRTRTLFTNPYMYTPSRLFIFIPDTPACPCILGRRTSNFASSCQPCLPAMSSKLFIYTSHDSSPLYTGSLVPPVLFLLTHVELESDIVSDVPDGEEYLLCLWDLFLFFLTSLDRLSSSSSVLIDLSLNLPALLLGSSPIPTTSSGSSLSSG